MPLRCAADNDADLLLLANLDQNVASSLLLHTGFFREIARVATFLVVAMAAMTGVVLAMGLDVVGFIGGYAAVYVAGCRPLHHHLRAVRAIPRCRRAQV